MKPAPLLDIAQLNVSFYHKGEERHIIKNLSFKIFPNQITAIVGESGSGKSVTSLAIMGLLPDAISKVRSGEIRFMDKDLLSLSEKQFQKLRGNEIAMIFQEPMSSLNPSMTCGKQVEEILNQHRELKSSALKTEVITLFERVKLPEPERIFGAYPHQLSGGQKQRVMIAMAIACKPKLLIADEPTTALDVTVQKEILELLKTIQHETGMSILFISHDLSLVSELADEVVVMYKGEGVEQGNVSQIFKAPQHNYTKALIAARPGTKSRLKVLPTIQDFMEERIPSAIISNDERLARHHDLYRQSPLLEVIDLKKEYLSKSGWFNSGQKFKAVDGVSFKIYPGETLGLVGESGCGKSTLGNTILQLDKASSGKLYYNGKDITQLNKKDLRQLRKDIQIIFQDPFASLNPRLKIGEAILEPMKVHGIESNYKARKSKVLELLKRVGLNEEAFNRFPHEFSGGQRQRVGIARTIAVQPKLIICDESVSALDISVQAQVLNLLNELKAQFGFTYIFISHDLAVVRYMADQLLVMNKGKIEESGEADAVFNNPAKPYTKRLISAIPKGL